MIRSVRIRGLGVIDETVLEPSSALTAVTGETAPEDHGGHRYWFAARRQG